MSHLPTCDLLVRNGDCTCPPEVEPDQRAQDVAAAEQVLCRYFDSAGDTNEPGDDLADLIAAAREQGRREGDPRPCGGVNSNVCVAEGCYNYACLSLPRADAIARGDR